MTLYMLIDCSFIVHSSPFKRCENTFVCGGIPLFVVCLRYTTKAGSTVFLFNEVSCCELSESCIPIDNIKTLS